jgi:DNA invertase Pin-like site-specific DNA recombinase
MTLDRNTLEQVFKPQTIAKHAYLVGSGHNPISWNRPDPACYNVGVANKPRAYSYIRFSTVEQGAGDSLRRQSAAAEEYAKRHGMVLDTELTMRDAGVSAYRGRNVGAGALGAFLKAISEKLVTPGSVLLVESLDRISRQEARKALRTLEEVIEGGVDVVTLSDNRRYNLDSINGPELMWAIMVMIRAREESETKSRRIRAAWVGARQRAAKHEIVTTAVPAWIEATGSAARGSRNAKFTLHEERAQLVQRMFALFISGVGKKAIAETLNRERVPTWGARGKGRKPAKYWHASYILKILKNAAVTGVFTPFLNEYRDDKTLRRVPQEPIPNYFPQVIDTDTFERVQSLLAARTKSVRSGHVASLVAGLARCPHCRSTMTRVMKGSNPKKAGLPKLVCVKAKAGAGCQYHAVSLRSVERALIDNADRLGHPPLADSNIAEAIKDADADLTATEEEIENLLDSIQRSPSDAATKRLAQREAAAVAMRKQLEELQARGADSESRIVKHRARRVAELLKRLDKHPEELTTANAALCESINAVEIDYPNGDLVLQWRHGVTSKLMFAAGTLLLAAARKRA